MNYKKYIKARNASWQILIDCDVRDLPVDVFDICKKLQIRVASYDSFAGKKIIKLLHLEQLIMTTDGLCITAVPHKPIILYDSTASEQRQRFTIAHEIGHLVLQHTSESFRYISSRNCEPDDDAQNSREAEANVFASRLLCPACVLWKRNIRTAEEIAEQCNVSLQAAGYRMKRMQLLYARNKFLTHPLERELAERFI